MLVFDFGELVVLMFDVFEDFGCYVFVCIVCGYWVMMNGMLCVVVELSEEDCVFNVRLFLCIVDLLLCVFVCEWIVEEFELVFVFFDCGQLLFLFEWVFGCVFYCDFGCECCYDCFGSGEEFFGLSFGDFW